MRPLFPRLLLLLLLLLPAPTRAERTPGPCPDNSSARDQIGWEWLPDGVRGVVWGPEYCPGPPGVPPPAPPEQPLPEPVYDHQRWLPVISR